MKSKLFYYNIRVSHGNKHETISLTSVDNDNLVIDQLKQKYNGQEVKFKIVDKQDKVTVDSFNFIFEVRDLFAKKLEAIRAVNKINKSSKYIVNLYVNLDWFCKEVYFSPETLREMLNVSHVEIICNRQESGFDLDIDVAANNGYVECSRCQMGHLGNGYQFGYVAEYCDIKKSGTQLCIRCIDVLKKDHPNHWSVPYLLDIEKKGFVPANKS